MLGALVAFIVTAPWPQPATTPFKAQPDLQWSSGARCSKTLLSADTARPRTVPFIHEAFENTSILVIKDLIYELTFYFARHKHNCVGFHNVLLRCEYVHVFDHIRTTQVSSRLFHTYSATLRAFMIVRNVIKTSWVNMKSARLYEIGVIYLVLYEFVHMFSINFISACSVIYLLLSSNVIDSELNRPFGLYTKNFIKLFSTFLSCSSSLASIASICI